MSTPTRSHAVFALLCAISIFVPARSSAQVDISLLEMYRDEIARLVDSPGASGSVAAGRINPAAWAIQGHGGVYFGYEDRQDVLDRGEWIGVGSLRYLGFGVRQVAQDNVLLADSTLYNARKTEYTIGLSLGDRGDAFGVSYTWDRGDRNLLGDSRRLGLGNVTRWSWGSVGTNTVIDFDLEQSLDQVDLALRPFGPRLTFFGDFMGWYQNDSDWFSFDWDEKIFGYGVEVQPIAGAKVGFRADDRGFLGFRVNVGFDTFRPSVRYRTDNDGDHLASTYAFEFAPGPSVLEPFVDGRYPEIELRGPVAYRNYGWFDDRTRFVDLLARFDRIAEDPTVDGVVVRMSGLQVDLATAWELRAQIAGVRAHGKKILVYADRLDMTGMMLASVADEIWLDPLGGIDMTGLNFGRSYYADMLEKAGIGFDEWRFLKYKSAAESFSRTGFSEGAEEQLTAVLESYWTSLLTPISNARGLSLEELERIVNEKGQLLPKEAQELGLVDNLGGIHDLRDDKESAVRRPGVDDDVALLGATFGDRQWRDEEWGRAPKIAIAYAIGPCAMDSGIRGRELSQWIRTMREDDEVAAIILRADSPGGDPLPSDLVAREIRETRGVKPILVSQGRVAGSGGYWISMDGDEILASPFTITGSIGVIGAHVYDDGLAERLGIDYDHVQRGTGADLYGGPSLPLVGLSIPHRALTDAEKARVRELILDLYDDFVAAVAEGRDMTREEVEAVAQGRIWTGVDAQEIDLVDEIAGLWTGIVMAKQEAGLDAKDRIELVEGPDLGLFPPGLFRPSLLGMRLAAAVRGETFTAPVPEEWRPWNTSLPAPLATVISPTQWDALSTSAQTYLLHLLYSPTRPSTMMEPFEVDLDGPAMR